MNKLAKDDEQEEYPHVACFAGLRAGDLFMDKVLFLCCERSHPDSASVPLPMVRTDLVRLLQLLNPAHLGWLYRML